MMEYLQVQANVTWTHVPYKGGSEALLGVMSDNIDVMSTGVSTILGHVKKGSVHVLALTSQARWPGADKVPTLTEQGVNIATYSWYGIMAPKGTPAAVVDYLYQQVVALLAEPAMKASLDAQGVQGIVMPPADIERMVRDETQLWARIVRTANIKIE